MIVNEVIRFLEFVISKRSGIEICKNEEGRYRYGLSDIDVKRIADNRYLVKDLKELVLHCKSEEAECKLISRQEFKNIEHGEKNNFKIISKVKYAFFD